VTAASSTSLGKGTLLLSGLRIVRLLLLCLILQPLPSLVLWHLLHLVRQLLLGLNLGLLLHRALLPGR
jgi:hypothetical protein